MDQLDQIAGIIALTMGAAWASGINLYAAIVMLGLLGQSGNLTLPPDLQILTNPLVIGAAGLMYIVEFFADKVPGVDTTWDTLHTFIRIPAGAALAAGAVGDMNQAVTLAAAIAGGGLAAATHATKAGTRVVVNASPEPFSNWALSISEDVAVFAGLWAALNHPWLFLGLLVIFILLLVWILPKIWRGIRRIFAWIGRLLSGRKDVPTENSAPSQSEDKLPPADQSSD